MTSVHLLLLSFTLLLLRPTTGNDERDYLYLNEIFDSYLDVCKTKRNENGKLGMLKKALDEKYAEVANVELHPVIYSLSYAVEATKEIFDTATSGDISKADYNVFDWHCNKIKILYNIFKLNNGGRRILYNMSQLSWAAKRKEAREALEEFKILTKEATKEEDQKEAIEIMNQFEPMEKRLNNLEDALKAAVEEGNEDFIGKIWACGRFLGVAREKAAKAGDKIAPALSAAIHFFKYWSAVDKIEELTEDLAMKNIPDNVNLSEDLGDFAKSLRKLFRFQYLWGYDIIAAYEKVLNQKTAGSKGSTAAASGNAGLQAKGKAIKQKRRRQKRRQRK